MIHLELPKENYFLTEAKIRKRNAQRDIDYLKNDGCTYFYVLVDSIYEQDHYGDDFQLTNGVIEDSYSEQQLVSLGAIKHYYE